MNAENLFVSTPTLGCSGVSPHIALGDANVVQQFENVKHFYGGLDSSCQLVEHGINELSYSPLLGNVDFGQEELSLFDDTYGVGLTSDGFDLAYGSDLSRVYEGDGFGSGVYPEYWGELPCSVTFQGLSTGGSSLPTVSLVTFESKAVEPTDTTSGYIGKFVVQRTGNLNSLLVIDYTLEGTATNGVDYHYLTGQLTFLPGMSRMIINIIPLADTLQEGSETVIARIKPSSRYRLGPQTEGTLFILDGANSNFGQERVVQGTLDADTFTWTPGYRRTVFIGNGNVSYGQGMRDEIDLSRVSYGSVSFNLAQASGGGVLFNPGNGTRLFDALTLADGSQILFEGIEQIRFADRTINLVPSVNDPSFSRQWNLHMIGVHHAWRFTQGSSQVLIGIQDSGLGVKPGGVLHWDLRTTRFLSGTNHVDNYVDDFQDLFTRTLSSHGTSVQGIIAARSNNGSGIAGINWNSDVFHIDVLGANFGDLSLVDATQAMINVARAEGKRLVINMSFGSFSYGENRHPDLEGMIRSNPDVLFVVASGNRGHTGQAGLASPAIFARDYANVIAVGSVWGKTDWFDQPVPLGTRINYPNHWGSQYGQGLTLMAPSEVVTTQATRRTSAGVEFLTNYFSGTSASAPHVTGVASLVWSVNPYLTAAQVRTVLSETAYDQGPKGYDPEYGHGIINADASIRRALALRQTT